MEKLPWIVIAVLLGYILFLQQCRGPEVIREEGETVVHRDTVSVVETDTVFVELPPKIIEVPVPVPDVSESGVYTYRQGFGDEWLTGYLWAETTGLMNDWGIEYVLRYPFVTRRERELVTTVVTVPQYLSPGTGRELLGGWGFLAGAELSGNADRQSVSVLAGFERGKYAYLYRYDPFLKVHGAGMMRRF